MSQSLREKYIDYLEPPLTRSGVLHAISHLDGQMIHKYTVKSLRTRYPGLPSPLTLEKLAEIGKKLLEGRMISDFEK